jgi:ribosomal-protein-alanine N-acetyltransferase
MNIEIIKCMIENRSVIENLIQFYFYDLQQCSQYAHYPLNTDGRFKKMPYFDNYWEEKNSYPYLIKLKDLPIGFALVHGKTLDTQADWKMAEFFILAAFRKQGIANYAVNHIMKLHHGVWEVSVLKDNTVANAFWNKVLPNATPRQYSQYPDFLVYIK